VVLTVTEIRSILNASGPASQEHAGHEHATGYSIDSRTLAPGDLFIAIHGERFDGHTFVADVLARGAVAAVVARSRVESLAGLDPARLIVVESTLDALQLLARRVRERWHGQVIGVTGSVGKTTTKEAVAKVLSSRWHVLKSHGNLNNGYGMPLQLLKVEPHHSMAVLEMGMSSAGEIAALAAIAEPDWGVVTIVAPVHTEFFADGVEGVARAKRELVEALPATGVAFLNADDARVAAFRSHTQAKVVTFGWKQAADVYATGIQDLGMEGTAFLLEGRGQSAPCRLRLVGVHNVTNALAAAAVGIQAGLSVQQCAAALGELQPPDSRGQTLTLAGAYLINDCYNSNPLALNSMVDTLASAHAARRIVVAGEMLELGPEADALHADCGKHMASRGINVLVGVRGHARAMVQAASAQGVHAMFVETPEEAGDWLADNLQPDDAVLLKASRGVKLERALERLVERLKARAGEVR
jgi:UDP-N-acetylmuramoyl-tripeptide--D-alanyl-D-alanine ligase